MKDKVIFLYNEKESDLFAYFPEITANLDFKTCYAHAGQHSSCHPDYAKESRHATKKEYIDLETELISLGYKLDVINKRLEDLRTELRNECISYGELTELQNLIEYIEISDVELLEAAGVPE